MNFGTFLFRFRRHLVIYIHDFESSKKGVGYSHNKYSSACGPAEDHHTVPPVIDRPIWMEEDITYLLHYTGSVTALFSALGEGPLHRRGFSLPFAFRIFSALILSRSLGNGLKLVYLQGLQACVRL